jgi:predicted XRE-type DNA-binding protein
MSNEQRFASVWNAIEDTPQQAASIRARSTLMMELESIIKQRGMTRADAAALFGVTQPRISDLMRGKINLFSLDCLIDMATVAGLEPHVAIKITKNPRTARKASALHGQHSDMANLVGVATGPDHDFYIVIECSQKLHQALDGELIESVVFQRRNFGLRYAEKQGDFALFQLASREQFIDRQCQSSLDLPLGGIFITQVGEDVGGAAGNCVHEVRLL